MPNTTVRTTPDIERIKQRFGDLLVYQEAFEMGCDLLARHLEEIEREENNAKLLEQRKFYDSLEKVN